MDLKLISPGFFLFFSKIVIFEFDNFLQKFNSSLYQNLLGNFSFVSKDGARDGVHELYRGARVLIAVNVVFGG